MHKWATCATVSGAPCGTLGELFNPSRPQFPPLKHGGCYHCLCSEGLTVLHKASGMQPTRGRRERERIASVPTGQVAFVPIREYLLPFGIGDGISFSIWTKRVSENGSKKARMASIGLPSFPRGLLSHLRPNRLLTSYFRSIREAVGKPRSTDRALPLPSD